MFKNQLKECLISKEIYEELNNGKNFLSGKNSLISVFGGGQISSDSDHYRNAEKLSELLSIKGYQIITGGGPGIMEAANKGASNSSGKSIGVNISINEEQQPNLYLHENILTKYFLSRKYILMNHSKAFVIFPGGFGTLDELFEVLTLIKTKKIKEVPIFLVGREFWYGLQSWLKEFVYKENLFSNEDKNIFTISDDLNFICSSIIKNSC